MNNVQDPKDDWAQPSLNHADLDLAADWWVRHHRAAQKLLALETRSIELPLNPWLDWLCSTEYEKGMNLGLRHHSSWVLQDWCRVFTSGTWWPDTRNEVSASTCLACEGECRYQITPSEPTAPETSVTTYVPWSQIGTGLKASGVDPSIFERPHGSQTEHNHSPIDSHSREVIDAALQLIFNSADQSIGLPFSYLLQITDIVSSSKTYIVATSPKGPKFSPLDDRQFVVHGTFGTGMAALLFRINQLGPAGAHEISDEHLIRLTR